MSDEKLPAFFNKANEAAEYVEAYLKLKKENEVLRSHLIMFLGREKFNQLMSKALEQADKIRGEK
jgi:radical SAM superfamily enzyme